MEEYKKIFQESLNINKDLINDKLKYNDIPEWDSIGHMTLIAALEEKYKISIQISKNCWILLVLKPLMILVSIS